MRDSAEWRTAIHESAHVVVGCRLGLPPRGVVLGSLNGDSAVMGKAWSHAGHADLGAIAVMKLAGRSAELRAGVDGPPTWGEDHRQAVFALAQSMPKGTPHWRLRQLLEVAAVRADTLVQEEWICIHALATELMRARVLDGTEIRRVLERC